MESLKNLRKNPINSWIVIAAFIIMGGTIFFYFGFYVEKNEKVLVQKLHRDIDRVSENFLSKVETFKKNAKNKANEDSESTKNEDTVNNKNKNNKVLYNDQIERLDTRNEIASDKLTLLEKEKWYVTDIREFSKPLFQNTRFEHFIVIKDTAIGYSSYMHHEVTGRIDSLWNNSEVTIGGQTFRMFKTNLVVEYIDSTETGQHNKVASQKQKLILIGLISNEHFRGSTRQINSWVLTLLGVLLILVLLAIPVLKIRTMGKNDRLSGYDALLVVLSLLFGTTLLTLAILTGYDWYAHKEAKIDERLKMLADTTEIRFEQECNSIVEQLHSLKDSCEIDIKTNILENKKLLAFYPYLKYVYWMDNSGYQVEALSIFDKEIQGETLRHRDYFKKVINEDLWSFKNKEKKFVLESIYSTSSGNALAVVSTTTNKNNPVIAISTPMFPVIDVAYPYGYDFCIFDETGEVWFHSNKSLNHQENFFEEIDNKNYILARVKSSTRGETEVTYRGKERRMHIRTLRNLPLYVATFYNKELAGSFNTNVLDLSFVMYVILFGLFIIQVLVLVLLSIRKSRLNLRPYAYTWIRFNAQNNYYPLSILLSLIILVFSICINIIYFMEQDLFMQSTLVAIATPALIFALNYSLMNSTNGTIFWRRKAMFIFFTIALIVLMSSYGLNDIKSEGFYWWLFCCILLVVSGLILKRQNRLSCDGSTRNNKFLFYNANVAIWLISLTFVPVLFFYTIAYKVETTIVENYTNIHNAQSVISQSQEVKNFYSGVDLHQRKNIVKNRQSVGNYTPLKLNSEQNPNDLKCVHDTALALFLEKLLYFRPLFDQYAINSQFFGNRCDPVNRQWNIDRSDSVFYTHNSKPYIFTKPEEAKYERKWDQLIVFVLLFIILVLGIIKLLIYLAAKLFGHNIVVSHGLEIERIPDKESGLDIIILPPYSDGLVGIKSADSQKDKYIDLEQTGQNGLYNHWLSQDENYNQFIFHHFEYQSYDEAFFKRKRQTIEKLLTNGKHVVILTKVHPVDLAKMAMEQDGGVASESIEIESKQWQELCKDASLYYYPSAADADKTFNELSEPVIFDDLLAGQCSFKNTWNHLSADEKYFLYNFCKYNLINPSSPVIINQLANKGVLVDNGAVEIYDDKFRHHVLVDEEPKLETREQFRQKKKSKWQQYRVMLILLIIGFLVFIYFGNQSMFQEFKSIIITIGAIAGVLVRFSGGSGATPST